MGGGGGGGGGGRGGGNQCICPPSDRHATSPLPTRTLISSQRTHHPMGKACCLTACTISDLENGTHNMHGHLTRKLISLQATCALLFHIPLTGTYRRRYKHTIINITCTRLICDSHIYMYQKFPMLIPV